MRTLIIEDDPVSRQLLHRLLSQNGVCDALESATLGLEAFSTSLKKNQRYDLICLDIMLPDANGMDVLRELRSLEAKAGVEGLDRSSVLMITSLDSKETVLRSFREGCEGFLPKPFSKQKLEEQLVKLRLLGK